MNSKVRPTLKEIQETYFHLVQEVFGDLYLQMGKQASDPYEVSEGIGVDESKVKQWMPKVDSFVDEIKTFWRDNASYAWFELSNINSSKAVFGGEIFPDTGKNIASSTAVYFDTTVLPEPFLNLAYSRSALPAEDWCTEIIRLAMQLLAHKHLALSYSDIPILVVLPGRLEWEGDKEGLFKSSELDVIRYTNDTFNLQLNSTPELIEYFNSLKNLDDVSSRLVKPDTQIIEAAAGKSVSADAFDAIGIEANAGQNVYLSIMSRFMQATEIHERSTELGGTPVIRAENSWNWYIKMLAQNSLSGANENLHIVRAMNTTVPTEIPWMGDIPIDSLIELRKTGALDEVRETLSSGVSELMDTNSENFFRTSDQVFNNLDKAFAEHEDKIKDLQSKKWKFAGRDIGSFIVFGGIEIAAAITGNVGLAITGAAVASIGMPSAKELLKQGKDLKSETKELNKTGIGILFSSKK